MNDIGIVVLAALTGILCTLSSVGIGAALYWMVKVRPPKQPVALDIPPSVSSDFMPPPPPRSFSPAPPAKASGSDMFQTIVEDALPANLPYLEGIGGVISGQKIDIFREETLIGRSRVCDVQIHDPKVSRQHALLRLYKGRYFIQDMQSSRGTLVNNRSIETHPLAEGDEIRIGDSTLVFHLPLQS